MKLKLIIPACLAAILAACVTPPPKPGTEAHQRMLEEQAKENFYALKAQERAAHPAPAPAPAVAQAEPPAKVRLKPFNPFVSANPAPAPTPKPVAFAKPTPKPAAPARPLAAAKPAPAPKPSSPSTFSNHFARLEKPKQSDETIYLYDMPHGPEPSSPRYRAYKIQYAHELAKRPEDLTPEEREWVRRHYRDN